MYWLPVQLHFIVESHGSTISIAYLRWEACWQGLLARVAIDDAILMDTKI